MLSLLDVHIHTILMFVPTLRVSDMKKASLGQALACHKYQARLYLFDSSKHSSLFKFKMCSRSLMTQGRVRSSNYPVKNLSSMNANLIFSLFKNLMIIIKKCSTLGCLSLLDVHIHTILMLVPTVRVLDMKSASLGQALACLVNIRLGCTCLRVENTLAARCSYTHQSTVCTHRLQCCRT